MQSGLRTGGGTSLQTSPRPVLPDPEELQREPVQREPGRLYIISAGDGMELPAQTAPPPESCSPPGPGGRSCWNLDLRVTMLVLTLAGVVVLLLLYRLLQMRHR